MKTEISKNSEKRPPKLRYFGISKSSRVINHRMIINVNMTAFLAILIVLSALNIKNVAAETVPVLIHEHNKINVFEACAYYRITSFSTLKDFNEETLYTHSKNEVIGIIKNGLWEYEYIEPYTVEVLDKTIPYTVKECNENNVTKETECNDITLYNRTYKEETRFKSSWLDADKLLADSIKLSNVRSKPTQNVRFCADIEREWTSEGFTIKVDVIPNFDGFIYYSYAWFDDSFAFKMPVLGQCTHCTSDEEFMLDVNNGTSNAGVFINNSLEIFWGIFTLDSTWKIIGYIYFNNETDYVLVDPTETTQIDMFIDEGNSTSFGTPEPSLVAWWNMNCANDGTCPDLSIYNNFGENQSANQNLVEAIVGRGMNFTSTGGADYISSDSAVSFDASTENYTVIAWFNFTDLATSFQGNEKLFVEGRSAGTAYAYQLFCGVTTGCGFQMFSIIGGIKVRTLRNTSDLFPGVWNQMVLQHTPSNSSLFINGVYVGSAINTIGDTSPGIGFRVGAAWNNAQQIHNTIVDEVRIYNRSLTANEIIMNNKTVRIELNVTDIGNIALRPPPQPPPPPPIHSFILFKLISLEIPFIGWYLELITFKAVILFMDRLTVTGNVDIGGNLNVTGNWSGNDFFGETNMHPDGNITININTQDVHENITGFNESKLNGFRLQGNDTLIVDVAGRYNADFWLGSSGAVKKLYESCITVNGEHKTPHSHGRISSAGDVSDMSGGGVIDLEVGDQINLQIRNTQGTQDVEILYAGIRFVRIGD